MAIDIKKCPKCFHVRRPEETAQPERCPACGLYFEKWARRDDPPLRVALLPDDDESLVGRCRAALRERLCNVPGQGDARQLAARAAMLLFFTIWGLRLAAMDFRDGERMGSFMHNILLPIHEAGHIFLIPFGHFMTILGGSLFQVVFPLIVAATVLWQNRDPFGAALGVWWCGVSWLDLAPYIFDAKNPQLIMIGGHTGEDGPHDWIYLLGVFGRIGQSPHYGMLAHRFGVLVMLAGLIGAGWVLWRMWQRRNAPITSEPPSP